MKLKEQLRALIAQGKTGEVVQQLLEMTSHIGDEGLKKEMALHANRYENFTQKQRTGALSMDEEKVFLAQINTGLLDFIQRLPEDIVASGNKTIAASQNQTPKWQWLTIAGAIVAILAGIASFSGYTLKDLFSKETPEKVETPPGMEKDTTSNEEKKETEKVDTPIQEPQPAKKVVKQPPQQPKSAPKKEIHQTTQGEKSPNVVNEGDGPVIINYGDWEENKADTSKNK